jgi:hypothetical protein
MNRTDTYDSTSYWRETLLNKNVVHGLPINGTVNGKPAIDALAGGSFLASYFYARPGNNKLGVQVDRAIELVGRDEILFLDNGAFTAFKNGVSIADDQNYLDGFYAWAKDVCNRCPQAVVIIPDVIDGTTDQNNELISEANQSGLDDDRLVPVWHLHESLEQLTRLVETFNHIAIGSSGDYWKVNSPEWQARIDAMFAHLDAWFATDEADGIVRPKLHMLRGIAVMDAHRFDSADSVNVAVNHGRQASKGETLPAFRARVEGKAKRGEVHGAAQLGTAAERNNAARDFDIARTKDAIADFQAAGQTDHWRYQLLVDHLAVIDPAPVAANDDLLDIPEFLKRAA